MAPTIGRSAFINVPSGDLLAQRRFWEAVGVRISEDYSDENALAVAFSDHVVVMYLVHDFYRKFLGGREIADTKATSGALIALDAGAKQDVDTFVDAALVAGGTEIPPDPEIAGMMDPSMMYGRDFTDLDGHQYEIMWMSPDMPQG